MNTSKNGAPVPGNYVSWGRHFVTATFTADDAANAFMAANPGHGLIGIDKHGVIHVADNADKGKELPRPGRMLCCCCAGVTEGRQWHNQDIGHGLGTCCVEFVSKGTEDMERTYGLRGVHYDLEP